MGETQRIRWRGDSESSASSLSQKTSSAGSAFTCTTAPTALSSSCIKTRTRSPYPSNHASIPVEAESRASLNSSVMEPEEELPHRHARPPSEPHSQPDVLPATSRDFSELFPSTRKLLIHHDDTTLDGNMNLRVDTPVTTPRGLSKDITLFHLRMYNLRCRDFSLRRYCRDSGREICHCVRKSHKSMLGARPNIQRSLSNAFSAMIPKSEVKHQQQQKQHPSHLTRQDSGYATMHSDEEDDTDRPQSSHSSKAPSKDATGLVSLEFSNYAHLDLKRRGFKADKRYDFDYWGCSYSWRRSTQKMGKAREISYHLTRRDGSLVARIVPEPMSEKEVRREEDKGGWIPPCSLRILDKQINEDALGDVADVVVSTGLIVLADDCIRRHFHHQEQQNRGFHLPLINRRDGDEHKGSFIARMDNARDKPHRKLIPHSL